MHNVNIPLNGSSANFKRLLLVCSICCLIFGCATPKKSVVHSTRSYDDTYSLAVKALIKADWDIAESDHAAGLIVAERQMGGGLPGEMYTATILIEEYDDDTCSLRVKVKAPAGTIGTVSDILEEVESAVDDELLSGKKKKKKKRRKGEKSRRKS